MDAHGQNRIMGLLLLWESLSVFRTGRASESEWVWEARMYLLVAPKWAAHWWAGKASL